MNQWSNFCQLIHLTCFNHTDAVLIVPVETARIQSGWAWLLMTPFDNFKITFSIKIMDRELEYRKFPQPVIHYRVCSWMIQYSLKRAFRHGHHFSKLDKLDATTVPASDPLSAVCTAATATTTACQLSGGHIGVLTRSRWGTRTLLTQPIPSLFLVLFFTTQMVHMQTERCSAVLAHNLIYVCVTCMCKHLDTTHLHRLITLVHSIVARYSFLVN